jgi:hypothetical protein
MKPRGVQLINLRGIPRPTFIVPIHGTWSLNDQRPWWKLKSSFEIFCKRNNLFYKQVGGEPFIWSGEIDGINWKSLFGIGDKHDDWRTAGFALRHYLHRIRLENRNLILHSHAWQIYLYSEMPVRNIITIGSPMRADMLELAKSARDKGLYNYHCHVYDKKWDKIGFLGQIGDGKIFGSRHCDTATENKALSKIGHSGILEKEDRMTHWNDSGLFDILRKDFQ